MCLAVPMKVTDIKDDVVTAKVEEVEYEVNIGLLNDLEIGDYIIVHAGFAIQKLNEEEARESLQAWKEISENRRDKRESV